MHNFIYHFKKDDILVIEELQIGIWTDKYKEYLESITIDSKNDSKKQFIRYYNSQTLGDKRLVAIRSIDPKDKGKINPKIQTFIDISKVFNKDVVKRNKDILQIATFKKSKSVGMSTFDFDDTLAKTKSGVRVTMPNIDGKPKPKKKVIFF